MAIFVHEVVGNQTVQVDKSLWMYQPSLDNFKVGWSPDSRWLAYARGQDNRVHAVHLFDTNTGERHQVTSGYYDDRQPVFDPDGKYLYFLSGRTFRPSYSDVDNSFIYANSTNIMAVSLKPDIPSPVAPRSDEDELVPVQKHHNLWCATGLPKMWVLYGFGRELRRVESE